MVLVRVELKGEVAWSKLKTKLRVTQKVMTYAMPNNKFAIEDNINFDIRAHVKNWSEGWITNWVYMELK